MTQITIYEETVQRLEDLAEVCDTTVAEIIDSLLEYEDVIKRDYGI